jgi:hypothetical protein
MARPSKLTGELRITICDGIRLGVSFEEACRRAGIAPSTGHEWRARGQGRARRPVTPLYVLFAESVARAEQEAHRGPVSQPEPAFAEFAEPGFPDTHQKRARAREQEREVSPRAWLSQRSRDQRSLIDRVF